MFPRSPPFSYARIGEIVDHRSLDFVPERFLQGAVTIVDEHPLGVSRKPGKERAEPELVWRSKVMKGLYPAQEQLCKVAALLPGLDQFAPLRSEDIDARASALLILLPNLDRKINQRRDDADGGDHLPDCRKHFPIHISLLESWLNIQRLEFSIRI